MAPRFKCPFVLCDFRHRSRSIVERHIDEAHDGEDDVYRSEKDDSPSPPPATPRPSNARAGSREDDMEGFLFERCDWPGCGEFVVLSERDEHDHLHHVAAIAEQTDMEGSIELSRDASALSSPARHHHRRDGRGNHRFLDTIRAAGVLRRVQDATNPQQRVAQTLSIPDSPGRLGKRELGPHAYENTMPLAIWRQLQVAARPQIVRYIDDNGHSVRSARVPNETPGVVAAIADLCNLEHDTVSTYLCHRCVRHVHRLACDANFCGYWTIQMLVTYLQREDSARFPFMPNVLEIQQTITNAWNTGICSYGEVETGGILNTRKWIGTHEALAYFTQKRVRTVVLAFRDNYDYKGVREPGTAAISLLDYLEAYYHSDADVWEQFDRSFITQLPPIYLQRQGHSMAIIGVERKDDGSRNLLVFDSSFPTPEPMQRLMNSQHTRSTAALILATYRRSQNSLQQWQEFEILM